jgi:hypothetical protein
MSDGTFVDALERKLARPQAIKVNGVEHVYFPTQGGGWIRDELETPARLPEILTLGTLESFVQYLIENRDGLDETKLVIHVQHDRVRVLGPAFGTFAQRAEHARASLGALLDEEGFSFGRWIDPETFTVDLQRCFVPSPALAAVLKVVGNIKDETVRQLEDDGTTQTVRTKAGAILAEVNIPNPVSLAPYRTFREVEQPESRFVLRVRKGAEGQLPTCALFLADGEAWKLAAVESLRDWLDTRVPEKIPVLA